jgi:hypothetical protein
LLIPTASESLHWQPTGPAQAKLTDWVEPSCVSSGLLEFKILLTESHPVGTSDFVTSILIPRFSLDGLLSTRNSRRSFDSDSLILAYFE